MTHFPLYHLPLNWCKLLSALKNHLYTLHTLSRDAIAVTWKTHHFHNFTSKQNKLGKSEVVEKVISAADF